MEVVRVHGTPYISWGHHELGWSRRTTSPSWAYPIWGEDGQLVGELYPTKKAGRFPLPEGAKYLLQRYYTYRGKPRLTLYMVSDDQLQVVASITEGTTSEELDRLPVPQGIREYIAQDLWG